MSWTLCSSGAALYRAGANASTAAALSGGALAEWSNEAEGEIMEATRRNWVDQYTTVGSGARLALAAACSALIANSIINYDMSGYTSRSEAQTMLDVNLDVYNRNIEKLKDKESNIMRAP